METNKPAADPILHRQIQLSEAIGSRSRRSRRSTRLRVDANTVTDPADVSLDSATARLDVARIGELGSRLRELAVQADQTRSEFFEAIARFDELEGWRVSGARNCVRWMVETLGLGRSRAYEQYKVAKDLRTLPTIASHFASGKLNWCKVRALLQVATPKDEQALTIAALDLTPDEVQRLCDDYRFGKDPGSDADRDKAQRERRSLIWKAQADGTITMQVVLPPESGADVIRCLQYHEEQLFGGNSGKVGGDGEPLPGVAQRRSDSLVAMAHASLGGPGAVDAVGANASASARADRHLVVTHVELDALVAAERLAESEEPDSDAPLGIPLRAAIAGILGGSISPSTARRLACEGSLVTMIMKGGEPVAVGRRHRLHTTAQRRAILARDGGCTFPGCGATRRLDVHHTTLWRDGGETSVREGVTLCSACHQRVHDEGWRIVRRQADAQIVRNPDAQAVLDDADARTRAITERLDAHRRVFRFERPGLAGTAGVAGVADMVGTTEFAYAMNGAGAQGSETDTDSAAPSCNEERGVYRVRTVDQSRAVRFTCRSGVPPDDVTRKARHRRLAGARSRCY